MSLIAIHELDYRYPTGTHAVVRVSAQVESPQIIAIAGPNGSGKTTLLNLLAGLVTPSGGSIHLFGRPAASYSRAELCRSVAHVPQSLPQYVPFTVEEVVLTGRTPHGRGLFDNEEDIAATERAMAQTGVAEWRHRPFPSLSGGEQQRTLLAAAICQQPKILLLDEPGSHLDPKNEVWLWDLLRQMRDSGCLVVIVTHHLALAARHSDRVWLLQNGEMAADAAPEVALDPDRLSRVFQVPFFRMADPSGRMLLGYGH